MIDIKTSPIKFLDANVITDWTIVLMNSRCNNFNVVNISLACTGDNVTIRKIKWMPKPIEFN